MNGKLKFSVLLFPSLLGLCVGSVFGAVELQEGEITTIKNMVEHDSGTGPAPAKQNEMIHEKSKVSTEAASMAELTFGDSTITRMGANTSFSFQSKERLVKLDRGTVLINTPPGAGGATVDCGGVTGAVTGTTFLASLAGDGKVMFVLLEGSPMKITSGGVVTTIKPGQAASVGLAAPDSGGGDKGGGDKAGGDKASGDKGGGDKAGGDKAGGDQGGGDKGGGEKGGGDKPTASGGGGEKGGVAPAPAEKPRPVQVFDVDVKKMVESTPLIRDFAKPLPSAEKIQATVEVQQNKVSEGKMESLGMEVVAVKADGDLMVGSPKIEMDAPPAKEEGPAPRIEEGVAKNEGGGPGEKLDIATAAGGPGPGPDNLDIATAGPGEGPAPIVAQNAPPPDAPRVELPPPPAPVFNPAQNVIPAPVSTSITFRANDATRAYGEENPAFALGVVAGSLKDGDRVEATFRTPAGPNSAVGPYDISIGSYRIVSSSGADVTSNYKVILERGNLNLAKAEQSVSFTLPGSLMFGTDTRLSATKLDRAVVSFEVLSGPARIENGKLVATSGTGSVVVRAVTVGDGNYLGANAEQTISLAKAGQSVRFTLPGSLTFGTDTSLSATKLDSAVVSFEVVSGPAKIEDGKLVATSGTGSVVVRALTVGDGNYLGANAEQTINLAKAGQSVSFTLPSSLTFGTDTSLSATKLDSAVVSFEVVSGPAKIEDGKLVATSGTGSVVVRALTVGDGNYLGANAEQTINLAKAGQTLVIARPAVALTGGAFTLAATGNMTGTAAFSILEKDGRASVRPDGVVTLGKILGADTFTVRADVAGSENYLAGRTDLAVALGRDETAILAANPTRQLISGPSDSATVAALAQFFYFDGKATGVAGPSRFFSDLSSSTRSLSDYSDRSVALYDGRPGEFYAMGTLNGAGPTHDITLGSADTTIFANQMLLGERGLASRVLSKTADREIPDFNAAGFTSEKSAADLAFKTDGTAATSALPFYVLSASLAINPADAFGMFAGDYKAYLTYMDSAGVGKTINLLDRIGTSATDREGSAANVIAATFSDYATGQAINSATGDPIAGTFQPGSGNTLLQGTMGAILPTGKFFMTVGDLSEGGLGVLDNWSVTLAQRVKMSVLNGVGKRLALVSGLGGTEVTGTLWDVGQANLEFLSAGLMGVSDSEFYNLGTKWALESRQDLALNGIGVRGEAVGGSDVALATGGSLSLKNSKLLVNGGITATAAVGPVKLDGEAGDVLIQAARNVVITGADLFETSAGGAVVAPAPTSLAVVRTGDSLEMRNVVIRGFSATKLESTKAGSTGRVLMSGSSVRDFKIKELAGMAVNADAKIQMMAYDASGASEGTMTIEGRLPVAAKLASAIDNTLTGTLRDQMVDAVQIDLAARNVTLNNATMVAMQAINISAQTILVQNSLMTVIRNTGSINMYVQSGLVNTTFGGAVVTGQANFAGLNTFTIGNNTFNIGSQGQLNSAISSGNLTDTLTNGNKSEAGKVNVLRL